MSLPTYVDQAFAFAHGRIGVLQQMLIMQSDLDRMLGSHDLKELQRILTELKLTAQIYQGTNNPEEILSSVSTWVQGEVTRMAPEEKRHFFDILWLEGDGPLLAYLLKKQKGLTSAISQEPHSLLHAFPIQEVRSLVETGKSDSLPSELITFVKETLTKEHLTPAIIDTAVAQWIADRQTTLAKKSKSAGIQQYVAHLIDLQNLRTALRTLDESAAEREALLITGGTLRPKKLLGDRKQLAQMLDTAELGTGIAQSVRSESMDINKLERAFSDVLAKDIALLWNVPLSIEPLFAFAALTMSHLRLIRVLVIGKRTGLSPQELKHILPPFIPASHYVLS